MNRPEPKDKSNYSNALKYAAVGTQMMVLIGLGVFAGLKLDARLHTTPLFLVLLPVLALFFSLYQLYRQLVGKSKRP